MKEKHFHVRTNYILLLIWMFLCTFSGLAVIASITVVIQGSYTSQEELIGTVIGIFIWSIFFYLFLKLAKRETHRKIRSIHPMLSVKQVNMLLSKELFHKVEGLKDIWESEYWLRAAGQFVPKNYIIGTYDICSSNISSTYRNHLLILINGKSISCSGEFDSDLYVKQLRRYKSLLPHATIIYPYDTFKYWSFDNKKQLKARLTQYLLNHKAEELIYEWTDISGFHSTDGIEATDDEIWDATDSKKKKIPFSRTKSRDEKIEPRKEALQDQDFIDQFLGELKKFGDMNLVINETEQEQLGNSYLFILQRKLPKGFEGTYSQYIHSNSKNIWIILHYDDSLSILYETLVSLKKDRIPIQLYVTNDCSSFDDSYDIGWLGIEVRY